MHVLHVYVLLHLATQVASLAASVQQVLHLLGWLATEGLHVRICVWLWVLQWCYNCVMCRSGQLGVCLVLLMAHTRQVQQIHVSYMSCIVL